MNLETFQYKLEESISYFVSLGMSMINSYEQICPSLKAVGMFELLLAARNMSCQVTRAVRLQEMSIPEVTRINLVETRGRLQNLLMYFEQSDCDAGITYRYNENSPILIDPEEIVDEENIDLCFPEQERSSKFANIRKFLIEDFDSLFKSLIDCVKGVIEKIEKLIRDRKNLMRDSDLRMARLEQMEQYFQKHLWPLQKEKLIGDIKWELSDDDNKGKTETQIIHAKIRNLKADHELNSPKATLRHINQIRDDREQVALAVTESRDNLSFEDVMNHFQFRESIILLENRIKSIKLLAPCNAYQGKLFVNNAAYQVAKMLGRFFYNYVGFDKKVKAAFSCAAMMDAGMIIEENNARLMAEFINNEWLGENDGLVKDDDITKPLRKCAKRPFCTIDENNLRSFESKEFLRYKDSYWRAFSIINKVLVISENLEKAAYLDEIHPAIEDIDVESSLADDEKDVLKIINSDAGLKWG